MEKPRMKAIPDYLNMHSVDYVRLSEYNAGIDAMSTWIEGAVPSVDELRKVIMVKNKGTTDKNDIELAKEIHALLTRKLKGE